MSRRRTIAIIGATVLALLAIVVTRAVWQGRNALARGDKAIAEGKSTEAIRHWRRAARWYVPLAPHVDTAYARLEKTALEAGKAGDRRTALLAWRGIRSSSMATRSFFTPQKQRLGKANREIAALMAALEGDAADPGKTEAERAAWHKALLDKPVGPSVGWSLIAIAGFLLWIGCALWFCWSALDENDRLNRRVALRSGLLFLVGLIVWLAGLAAA